MFETIMSGSTSRLRFMSKAAALAVLATMMSGCYETEFRDRPESNAEAQGTVNFVLARVDGGSCSLFDAETGIDRVAGPVTTVDGVGTFFDMPAPNGMFLLECAGGRYEDEATADIYTADIMRTFVTISETGFNVTATPLTELAVRIVQENGLDPIADYSRILKNVGVAFGMDQFDLATAVPMDLNVEEADGSAGGRYAVVLAALSQLQLDTGGESVQDTLNLLQDGLATNGQFTLDEVQELYFAALENSFDNPLIDPNLGFDVDLDALFNAVGRAPKASQIEYVDAVVGDNDFNEDGEPTSTIDPNEVSTFEIVGTHLSLAMTATLGDDTCVVRDLGLLVVPSQDSDFSHMFADCPARGPGMADLVIDDRGRVESVTGITVSEIFQAESRKRSATVSQSKPTPGAGFFILSGTITAEAPGITPTNGAAHDYSPAALEVFPVAGVSLELYDAVGQLAGETVTLADGSYTFTTAPNGGDATLVVRAEVKKERAAGTTTGPSYNFTVRDNTSAASPKTLYQVSTPTNIIDFVSTLNVRIKVGFDANGDALNNAARQSAPFSILRVIKKAVDNLEVFNANVEMPTLSLYWSGDNIASGGDKNLGQIGTSHYAGFGDFPGVFVLGKASADTDEFDQGVLGHEFGHYLQAQLSFSDSPGGRHSSTTDFKDPGLSFGEGYGTAVGGLLTGSPFYCDVVGFRQTGGGCSNLNVPPSGSIPTGFYGERAIIYLMYGIGTIPGKGFAPFFQAVADMKNSYHAGTIFSFLDIYTTANPDVASQVQALMATANIKTTNPLGTLPAGTAVDPAIGADLEQVYIPVSLAATSAAPNRFTEAPLPLTNGSPSFCFDHNLPGANNQNGLGLTKRFDVTANFTGRLLMRIKDSAGASFGTSSGLYWDVRETGGSKSGTFNYNGLNAGDYYGYADVVQGRQYSLRAYLYYPAMLQGGNQCGFTVDLSRGGL